MNRYLVIGFGLCAIPAVQQALATTPLLVRARAWDRARDEGMDLAIGEARAYPEAWAVEVATDDDLFQALWHDAHVLGFKEVGHGPADPHRPRLALL